MHEYSIASSLLRMVEERAAAEAAKRVLTVHVRVGAASGVEVDLLETAWDVVRRNSRSQGAALIVSSPPTRWICPLCTKEIPARESLRCRDCDLPARLDGGDELLLERIELETA